MTLEKKKGPLPAIALGVALVLAGIGLIWWLRHVMSNAAPPSKKVAQEIHVIRPPPPPPDVPPPPPPPPDEKVDVPDPQQNPDPTPSNDPPPGPQLGLDAEGTAGGDAFGLLGNKGGRELVGSGGNAYAWYAGLIKNEILDALGNEKETQTGQFTIMVRVWVRSDGTIDRVRITQSSGDRGRDRAIETALSRISRLSQPPPPDMPESVSLRIVSHG